MDKTDIFFEHFVRGESLPKVGKTFFCFAHHDGTTGIDI